MPARLKCPCGATLTADAAGRVPRCPACGAAPLAARVESLERAAKVQGLLVAGLLLAGILYVETRPLSRGAAGLPVTPDASPAAAPPRVEPADAGDDLDSLRAAYRLLNAHLGAKGLGGARVAAHGAGPTPGSWVFVATAAAVPARGQRAAPAPPERAYCVEGGSVRELPPGYLDWLTLPHAEFFLKLARDYLGTGQLLLVTHQATGEGAGRATVEGLFDGRRYSFEVVDFSVRHWSRADAPADRPPAPF